MFFTPGDEKSIVHGVFTEDGLFDGTIVTRFEEFYVEPAKRYFPSIEDFHSVIYKVSDINLRNNSELCHSHLLSKEMKGDDSSYLKWPSNEKISSYEASSYFLPNGKHFLPYKSKLLGPSETGMNPSHHSHHFNHKSGSSEFSGKIHTMSTKLFRKRTKRNDVTIVNEYEDGVKAMLRMNWMEEHAKKRTAIDPKKTTCMLYLQADHLFYKKMGSVDACIEQMTRHVQKVNNIYQVVGELIPFFSILVNFI